MSHVSRSVRVNYQKCNSVYIDKIIKQKPLQLRSDYCEEGLLVSQVSMGSCGIDLSCRGRSKHKCGMRRESLDRLTGGQRAHIKKFMSEQG